MTRILLPAVVLLTGIGLANTLTGHETIGIIIFAIGFGCIAIDSIGRFVARKQRRQNIKSIDEVRREAEVEEQMRELEQEEWELIWIDEEQQ